MAKKMKLHWLDANVKNEQRFIYFPFGSELTLFVYKKKNLSLHKSASIVTTNILSLALTQTKIYIDDLQRSSPVQLFVDSELVFRTSEIARRNRNNILDINSVVILFSFFSVDIIFLSQPFILFLHVLMIHNVNSV